MLSITTADITLAITGYTIVFLVLLSLYLVFHNLPRVLGSVIHVQKRAIRLRDQIMKEPVPEETAQEGVLTGQETAAIAMALHLYLYQRHDDEDVKFTIQKIKKTYSPWSSKIYGVMNKPSF